ncbi:DUF3024 domain-containing protein [Persicobacter psychrovividus]|uniref:DUF3024 domain-containing protein n=1 Tax=Persicobacter psychrovividus TaxID=387638 RepID=A0ABN6LEV3_9BACT|nr:hypothetical protein PEPS_38920 [Persicobacter psychrovividus]
MEEGKVISIFEKAIQENVELMRPEEEMRNQLDIGYTFKDNVLIIQEIRPDYRKPDVYNRYPVAKARLVKTTGAWRLYWMGAEQVWQPYEPKKQVTNLIEFFKVLDEDEHACFWG